MKSKIRALALSVELFKQLTAPPYGTGLNPKGHFIKRLVIAHASVSCHRRGLDGAKKGAFLAP